MLKSCTSNRECIDGSDIWVLALAKVSGVQVILANGQVMLIDNHISPFCYFSQIRLIIQHA